MGKKKTAKRVILGIIVAFAIMAAFMFFKLQSLTKDISQMVINNIDLSTIEDGIYSGEYNYNDVLSAKVKITVEDNRIIDIDIVEHKCGLGKKAEVIADRVVESQNLSVDTVTGATGSSKVILKAIENALTGKYE